MNEYLALVAKVDAFARSVADRRVGELRCGPGCSACCEVELSVSAVEAARIEDALGGLGAEARARMARRAARSGRCVMLEDDGRCAIYAARPLVCRTQGLALAYPRGIIPAEAVRARGRGDRDITHCPLNFVDRAPSGEDALDAERVDQTLAVINHRHAEARGLDPLARVHLRTLAPGTEGSRLASR